MTTVVTVPGPVAVVTEPESFGGWVQAAPFRSHLLHLMAQTGMPWRVLAHLAGASPRAVLRLLRGRGGRPARKIDPLLARRLFALTADAVGLAARTTVDPSRATTALAELIASGHDLTWVSSRLKLPTELLVALQQGRRQVVSRLVETQLRAAAESVDPFTAAITDDESDDESDDGHDGHDGHDGRDGRQDEPVERTVAA